MKIPIRNKMSFGTFKKKFAFPEESKSHAVLLLIWLLPFGTVFCLFWWFVRFFLQAKDKITPKYFHEKPKF